MSKPKDKALYDKAKRSITSKIKKNSAYRSGLIVKKYKEMYKKKYGNANAYSGTKTTRGLSRWFKENWRTRSGSKTYKKKGDILRPTKRISKETPATQKELGREKLKKAEKIKAKKGRVNNYRKIK